MVGLLKVFDERVEKRPELVKGIIARLTFLHILRVVIQMREAEDEGEAAPLENL